MSDSLSQRSHTTMSDSEVDTYVEYELAHNKGIVTFRLLSRKFAIHVNAAKNALTRFYLRKRECSEPIYATFWLCGEPKQQSANGTVDAMDVDNETNTRYLSRKVVVVGEEDLESIKASFIKVHALHVYSLSAAPLQNSSELCRPSHEIRRLDSLGDADFARRIGKIISQHVKHGKVVEKGSKASSSTRPQANTPTLARSKSEHIVKEKPKAHQSPAPLEKGKLKTSGTLSWANAKTKDVENKPVKAKEKPNVGNLQKRGIKRKSDLVSQPQTLKEEEEEGEEEEKKDTKPGHGSVNSAHAEDRGALVTARIKKGVILSDDEEDTTKYSNRRKVRKAVEEDTELSLRAMMDIDDANVVKASKPSAPAVLTRDEEEEGPPTTDHAESAMDSDSDDPAPKARARPRKQKKNVPIGKNGLRKKRVVKSKTDFDEKGYMVTVDYSSYESVDEEEEEVDGKKARTKLKSATLRRASAKRKDQSALESEAKVREQNQSPASASSKKTENKKPSVKPIPKGRQSNSSQKSLASFFGSGGGKSQKQQ